MLKEAGSDPSATTRPFVLRLRMSNLLLSSHAICGLVIVSIYTAGPYSYPYSYKPLTYPRLKNVTLVDDVSRKLIYQAKMPVPSLAVKEMWGVGVLSGDRRAL